MSRATILPFLLGALGALPAFAQELASIPDSSPIPSASDGSIFSRQDARTITLAIPAPRGPILDRNGLPLAQNRVVWQLALQFEQFENNDRDFVIRWGRERIEKAKALLKTGVTEPTDEQLWNHYYNRRWLPLYITSHLSADEHKKLEPLLPKGLILAPVYQRYYPEGQLAAHIIGYTGSAGKLPTGPINQNEPLWEQTEGRSGLEMIKNADLSGEDGVKKLLYDEKGRRILEEQVKRPRPGGAIVTTINLEWQKQAEKALRANARRGAFVIIDVNTGEVLAMASLPSFDLNHFIPGINEREYKQLNEDPTAPLFGRAFAAKYPPGSTFKPMVAMTALNDGTITENTEINCPAAITLGDHTFHNHNKKPAGDLDVKRALALSNNIFFYQVGQRLGAPAFLSTAKRFGYGERSGLELVGETAGTIPTVELMKRRFTDGDAFNLAIGQGAIEASPLQVAQGMAGIANGGVLPRLHLINQIQDRYGRVTMQAVPERRNTLDINAKSIDIVRKGMRDVVNSEYGTGRSAALSFAELCGKTGTAQWNDDRRLAWFAGFLPYDEPRFAFAAVYEGKPGERPSGGKNAAPIVKDFFEPLKEEFKEILAPAPKAVEIVDEPAPPKAQPISEDEDEGVVPPSLPVDPLDSGSFTPPARVHRSSDTPPAAQPVTPPPAPRPPKAVDQGPAPAPVEGDGDEDGEGD